MAVVTTNLGVITAYGDAVAAGYTGTKAQWQALMANYATVGQQAAQDAQTASQAAQTATTKAGEASQSATDAAASAASITTPDATLTQAGVAADAKATGDEISDLKEDLSDYNAIDVLKISGNPQNGTHDGITFTFSGNTCTVVGTSTALAFANIYANATSLPRGLTAGSNIYVKVNTTDSNVRLVVVFYKSDGSYYPFNYIFADRVLSVPSDAVGFTARVDVPRGKTVNATIEFAILTTYSNKELGTKLSSLIVAKDTSGYVSNNQITLSNIVEDGFYVISQNWTVTDAPNGLSVTGLTVERFSTLNQSGFVKQIVEDLVHPTTTKRYYRFSNYNGSAWSDWVELGGDNYTNEYTFNEYSQTVELSASPQITADTNNYLAPTGDTTDRTADILAMLTSSKVCRLGAGNFYVNNLQMPARTMLCGSGNSTRIILSGAADGYAIKMGDYCVIKDIRISGSTGTITPSETLGGRHGILWQGNYTESHRDDLQPKTGIVTNVYIDTFTGGAITCYDTGYSTHCHLEVTNVYCTGCGAGINIAYWSEFHKFTNVRTFYCYYGCINNGGNNVFMNCDFSSCKLAFLMDNSTGQSPNNSHGSAIGCTFNHTNSNTGIGIKVLNCDNGFIFDGCQIFFSQINLDDSDGVAFSNCNFGYSNCDITISGGKAILFTGNIHQNTPTITISNNADVHFVNCYNRTTGAVVEP